MPYTSLFTTSSQTQPSLIITNLEARLRNYESALMSSESELRQIGPALEREIDRLTVLNTAYNQSGREDVWWPAYSTVSKEVRRLEALRDAAEKDRVKYAAVVRAAKYNLAAAREREGAREAKGSDEMDMEIAHGEGIKKVTDPSDDINDEVMQDV